MGRVFKKYLTGNTIYCCSQCGTHLACHDDIISKNFHGKHGKAYLLDRCSNVSYCPQEDSVLLTGLHVVADIYCGDCKTILGWYYHLAYSKKQKYKEGKFILEMKKTITESSFS